MKMLVMKLFVGFFLLVALFPLSLAASENEDYHEVIYFHEPRCLSCLEVEESGVLSALEEDGVPVRWVHVDEQDFDSVYMFTAFLSTYGSDDDYPIIFAGDDYYAGASTIIEAYESGAIHESARNPLREVSEPVSLRGWGGLVTVLVAGLLDGVNPCAIAMLLMFISILGFMKSKKMLMIVSASYIGGVLITYFLVGFGLLRFLSSAFMTNVLAQIGDVLYMGFGALAVFLFLITFYDFWVTRQEAYDKVKNQLPSRIKEFNRRIMERLTEVLKDENPSVKKTFYTFSIPFLIGIIVGVTEAACTGQIYFFILVGLHTINPTLGIIYLIIFNLLFILPLIIIAIVAIRSKNVMAVSNFFRENLSLIKILTALFFLGMAVFFFAYAFGFRIPNPFN